MPYYIEKTSKYVMTDRTFYRVVRFRTETISLNASTFIASREFPNFIVMEKIILQIRI